MRKLLIALLMTWNSFCIAQEGQESASKNHDWISRAQRVDKEAIDWLKEHLKERLASENLFQNPLDSDLSTVQSKKCTTCDSKSLSIDEHSSLYVFMSFSLEDNLWIQFSKELEKIGGVFILRGLPNNSFKELANRIFDLQEKGVNAPIQIHPTLFQEYEIQLVPTIVVADGKLYDKISGNLSLQFALEKMSEKGESHQAKILYQELKDQRKS